MEQHGNNHANNVTAIIPARYGSVRLPAKMLLPINGKPLILHTAEQAANASLVSRVIVATDDERILKVAQDAGFESVMTSPEHNSGTDRIAEVAAGLDEGTIVVNVQGDEPIISPDVIDAAITGLTDDVNISTTCEPINSIDDITSPNIVKVITDPDGIAIYFSRSPIPFPREPVMEHGSFEKAFEAMPELFSQYRKHTGIYVFRREFLLEYSKWPQSRLEKMEFLEQLRALERGKRIRVVNVSDRSIGVDTQADLDEVRKIKGDVNG